MKAKITISKPQGGNGDQYIAIKLQDKSSGVQILEFDIDLASFADAITGLGNVEGEISRLIGADHFWKIGKKCEVKNEYFDGEKHKLHANDSELRKFIESKSVDGWTLWDDGMRSQQNGAKHKISMKRWVDV